MYKIGQNQRLISIYNSELTHFPQKKYFWEVHDLHDFTSALYNSILPYMGLLYYQGYMLLHARWGDYIVDLSEQQFHKTPFSESMNGQETPASWAHTCKLTTTHSLNNNHSILGMTRHRSWLIPVCGHSRPPPSHEAGTSSGLTQAAQPHCQAKPNI